MAKKESRRVKTLSGFMKWVAQFNDGQYLFRGVSNENYQIEASASRRLGENGINPAKLLKINKEMIDDARLQGHDLKNGQRLSKTGVGDFESFVVGRFDDFAYSPDGKIITTKSYQRKVQSWDAITGKHKITLIGEALRIVLMVKQ